MNQLLFEKRDLHPGNVLVDYFTDCSIGDLGLSVLKSEASHINEIKGVMPYLAPELFNGGSYSQATDIYAFSIIMWEISSGEKPFHDVVHDKLLALRICKRFRPQITEDTPRFYQDLMEKCWHADPTKRPTAEEIFEQTDKWSYLSTRTQEIKDQIEKADEIRKKNMEIKKETKTSHPGAIYTSRLLTNITKGRQYQVM